MCWNEKQLLDKIMPIVHSPLVSYQNSNPKTIFCATPPRQLVVVADW